jgi:hypothetical protein
MPQLGTIMRSKTSGARVRVDGPGRTPDTFAGTAIGMLPQFSYYWHSWRAANFNPADCGH